MSDEDAFGYRPELVHDVRGVQVAEAKDGNTLQPRVVVTIRVQSGERYSYGLPPDYAEALAGELVQMAARAREKHWE